ncbi:hypothetical protein [Legionella septentrionalis]|uniref:hypothetical protein n=2 Tax=Legionellaceae TaxID=444 RepID=UPI000F8D8DD5|nr:hypothetical protein [Legionella septentrionalis]RUQ99322.1 hypothetical protein ELY11_04670 [Legionella septentrionalis]RUR14799.1 hypothetical protein ELY10_07570 [Legionella septentrionalis]
MPTITEVLNDQYQSIPQKAVGALHATFFQPFKKGATSDILFTLASPISFPLFLGVATAISASLLVTLPVLSPCLLFASSFLKARGADAQSNGFFRPEHLYNAAMASSVLAVICAVATPVLLLATLLSVPLALLSMATRAGATIVESARERNNAEYPAYEV